MAERATSERPPDGASVLLVTGDEALATDLRPLLATRLSCSVQRVADPAEAFEFLAHARVDLVLAHVRDGESHAVAFARRCTEDSRLRTTPVILLLEHLDGDAVPELLEAGAMDCIRHPGSTAELVARAGAQLRRVREHRRRLTRRRYNLSGDFTALDFTDLVALLEVGGVSGRLSLLTARGEGFLYFTNGRVTHASFGNLAGEDAVYALIGHREAQFEFCPGDWVIDGELPVTIFQSVPALVMEAARRLDEANGALPEVTARRDTFADEHDDALQPPPAPSRELAARIEALVTQPHALGKVHLLTRDQLREWPAPTPRVESWRLLLVSDLECGVQALTAVSTPLSESQLANALRRYPQVLAWSLSVDAAHQLEVVLVDQHHPRALLGSFRRRPTVVVFAPAFGDFQTIDLEGRSALIALMYRLRPQAFFGVGNADLSSQLADFSVLADCRVPVDAIEGRLWNLEIHPRAMLAGALRTWGKLAKESTSTRPTTMPIPRRKQAA